jgi:hypothetical protein
MSEAKNDTDQFVVDTSGGWQVECQCRKSDVDFPS